MVDVPGNITSTAVFTFIPTLIGTHAGSLSGQFETFNDADVFRVTLQGDSTYDFFLSADGTGNVVDVPTTLRILDSDGNEVASDLAGSGAGTNSFVSFPVAWSGPLGADRSKLRN
jgi:hypothetical protein